MYHIKTLLFQQCKADHETGLWIILVIRKTSRTLHPLLLQEMRAIVGVAAIPINLQLT